MPRRSVFIDWVAVCAALTWGAWFAPRVSAQPMFVNSSSYASYAHDTDIGNGTMRVVTTDPLNLIFDSSSVTLDFTNIETPVLGTTESAGAAGLKHEEGVAASSLAALRLKAGTGVTQVNDAGDYWSASSMRIDFRATWEAGAGGLSNQQGLVNIPITFVVPDDGFVQLDMVIDWTGTFDGEPVRYRPRFVHQTYSATPGAQSVTVANSRPFFTGLNNLAPSDTIEISGYMEFLVSGGQPQVVLGPVEGGGAGNGRGGMIELPVDAVLGGFANDAPRVVGRHIYYNNSAFDGQSQGPGTLDTMAIAPDKHALLPGQTATFENYTSYSRGINGIMVDLMDVPALPALSLSDFEFRVGNDNNPANWQPAPEPAIFDIQPGGGVGNAARVSFIWPDNTIQNQWLQVRVKASPTTGLLNDDVFYYGNAIGETGDNPAHAHVNDADDNFVINTFGQINVPIVHRADFNRDRNITIDDFEIVTGSHTGEMFTIVPLDSDWRYLDDGSNQGVAWRSPMYDDSNWLIGQAELGYGDGDENTQVSFGPDANNKHATTYFRYAIDAGGLPPVPFDALLLRLIRDDGIAVYINGMEVFRDNLAPDAAFNQFATAVVNGAAESEFLEVFLDPMLFIPGANNFLAVEVHQASRFSDDISFNLELLGIRGIPLRLITPPGGMGTGGAGFDAGGATIPEPASITALLLLAGLGRARRVRRIRFA